MEAQLKKIVIQPFKLNKEGEQTKPETAVLTFECPLDSQSQKDALLEIFNLLSSEWVEVTVTAKQLKLDGIGNLNQLKDEER